MKKNVVFLLFLAFSFVQNAFAQDPMELDDMVDTIQYHIENELNPNKQWIKTGRKHHISGVEGKELDPTIKTALIKNFEVQKVFVNSHSFFVQVEGRIIIEFGYTDGYNEKIWIYKKKERRRMRGKKKVEDLR